jgi:hypothetical protein
MKSLDVFTQDQLDEALADSDVIPICSGDGRFVVGGGGFVRAADAAHVTLCNSAAAEAGGRTTIVAHGTADVTARDSTTLDLHDSARARAYGRVSVQALDRSTVTAGAEAVVAASGNAAVTARGLATVSATDRCSVRALANARAEVFGDVRAWAWGSATVWARDAARVAAWGSAVVHAGDAAVVEALERATIVAGGSARVRAFGAAMVRARGEAHVEATGGASVVRHGRGAVVAGEGTSDVTSLATPAEWCEYYGVQVQDGVATLYKAVEEDFSTYHGGSYGPGTEPFASDWDGGERECGAGLHFSPRPTFALPHPDDRMRFVACPVRLEDIVPHPDGLYPDKVKARGVCAPVYEVHEDGTPVG